ncbi:MAG: hypothetical protein JWR05_786 [Mucilaginibacter sp.]|nr:hypothetical protein [Mucilaginibacter sp.]
MHYIQTSIDIYVCKEYGIIVVLDEAEAERAIAAIGGEFVH